MIPGYTFNPWRGCAKVSPGCANCYAEKLSARNPAVLGEWGPLGKRSIAAESYWQLPLKWERKAKKAGERRKVFCLSMGDVCDDRPELIEPRERLKGMIAQTPSLDWLLLSKRPENYEPLFGWGNKWPRNVWAGASVENQQTADKRIPRLLACPAAVRFLSVEPMLGPVDIRGRLIEWRNPDGTGSWFSPVPGKISHRLIDWVICGGESGPNARPMHPDWVRSLRDQCVAAGVPFFFKQHGEYITGRPGDSHLPFDREPDHCWSDDGDYASFRVGKKAAGRLLDGREWNEFPEARP